jgi:hypothetical protein
LLKNKRVPAALVLLLVAVCTFAATPSSASAADPVLSVDSARTDKPLVTSLPLTYTISPTRYLYSYRTVAEIDIPGLQPGDMLDVAGRGEATVPTTITDNVMLGFGIKISTTDSPDMQTETAVCDAMTVNVNLARRHETMSAGTVGYRITAADIDADGSVHVLLVMYAASLVGLPNTQALTFNYADLSVRWFTWRSA